MISPPAIARPHQQPSFDDLSTPEQLVLWTLRMWLEDHRNLGLIQQTLWIACGLAHVEAALAGFDGLLRTLRRDGRRALRLHPSGCRALSADERTLLALIAVHQARHAEHAAALVRWLVPPAAAARLSGYATAVATALAQKAYVLPSARWCPGADGGATLITRRRHASGECTSG